VHVYAVMVINVLMDFGTIPTVWYLCFSFFYTGHIKLNLYILHYFYAFFLSLLAIF